MLKFVFPAFVLGQFIKDQCINSITVHCDTCDGGFIERESRNVFEVGFILQYCEGFEYRPGFKSLIIQTE